ncbi:MAG: glycosyltransferase family 4 protein [Thermoleophilaceae bacterium]|nr:glycosyltransferase family 4 protein [Thermoleophilaceae bacterium]
MKLVEALPTVREAVPDAQLVLAGASTPYERQLHDRAKALGVGATVTSPGYVSEADLEGLYAAASVFVFPSLNEGVGLPLLEAMARDLAVVTSDRSALPEVAGDAALLVSPGSADEIAAATIRIITDVRCRERLVEKGNRRVRAFTWSHTARLTLETWRRAVLAPSPR